MSPKPHGRGPRQPRSAERAPGATSLPGAEEEEYRRQLQAAKRASLGQTLLRSARLLDEQAVARVRAQPGAPPLRPAHTRIFPHLDLDGTRLTELAKRLGVSKQAAGQLIEELEQMGVVERAADSTDGRAKLVRFTARGRRGLLHGLAVLAELEAEIAQAIGPQDVNKLHGLLSRLLAVLERRAAEDAGAPSPPPRNGPKKAS